MDFWQPIFPNNGYCLLDDMARWALLLFGASCFVLARPQQLWWHQYTTVRDFVEAAYATYAPPYVYVPSKAFDCAVTGFGKWRRTRGVPSSFPLASSVLWSPLRLRR